MATAPIVRRITGIDTVDGIMVTTIRMVVNLAEIRVVEVYKFALGTLLNCIRIVAFIDVPRNMGNMLMYGQNDIIRTNFRNEVIL